MLQILRSVRRLCEKVIRGRLQEQPMNCNFAPISMEQIISTPMCHIFLGSPGHALRHGATMYGSYYWIGFWLIHVLVSVFFLLFGVFSIGLLLNCCSLLKTLKLAVWTLSLICLHVFTLFVIDIHQIMLIPLFPTPLGFWLLPNRILTLRHIPRNVYLYFKSTFAEAIHMWVTLLSEHHVHWPPQASGQSSRHVYKYKFINNFTQLLLDVVRLGWDISTTHQHI